jgi:hypothetical protein
MPKRRELRGSTEARELELYLENTHRLYRMRRSADVTLMRHVCRGKFDRTKAARAYRPVVDEAARSYAAEFSTGRADARHIFSRTDRDEVAEGFTREFVERTRACAFEGDRGVWGCNDLPEEAAQMLQKSTCERRIDRAQLRGRRRRRRRR